MRRIFTLQQRKKWLILLAVIVIVIIAIGMVAFMIMSKHSNISSTSSSDSVERPDLVDESLLGKLATTDSPIDRSHIADGLAPPTNKWFSGFALQAVPKPGYNYPNSFRPTSNGFEFSLPNVTATKTAITGSHTPDIVVSIQNAKNYKITDYDELTVELTYYNASNQPLITVRVASGLPYVYVTAIEQSEITFTGATNSQNAVTRISHGNKVYGVSTPTDENSISLSKSEQTTFFSAPNSDSFDRIARYSEAVVTGSNVSYERTNNTFRTTFTYETNKNSPTLFARLPHQQENDHSKATYRSILGDLKTEAGTSFSFTTASVPVTSSLEFSRMSDDEKQIITKQLKSDVTKFEDKPDTYFGGKQLYRMAQLLDIAEQLGEDEVANTAKETLRSKLEAWLTPGKTEMQSFRYDPNMHGIVGNEASFGSDKEFNDHHFHYGYFIYSAALLAKYDTEFLGKNEAFINLLVADIANYSSDEELPLRRSFDPYAGHSWASGTVPFNDGNNEESTSEAINAWIGAALWAEQTDNNGLALEANWMLSQEYATANRYWLMEKNKMPGYLKQYNSPIASIVWGGKREYATFFSDTPNAKLAIQLLPLSPTIQRLDTSLPESLFRGTSTKQPYGDSLLMAQRDATLKDAQQLPDQAIDDGNSRTYLYAYIASR